MPETHAVSTGSRRGPATSFLRLFTDVREGETTQALLLTLIFYFLLLAYYLIKPVREALLLVDAGAPRMKSYLSGAQAVLFVFVIQGFSALASRVARQRLITRVTLFFISNLAVFYLLHLAGVPTKGLGIAFFIWIGMFNVLVVAQFWGFANDLYTEEAGKRLFPLIAFGATFGAVTGSWIAQRLAVPLGVYGLMLLSAAVLGACIALTLVIHRRDVRSGGAAVRVREEPLKRGGGFRLIFRSRYLLYIALIIGLYNFINATGEYIISDVATRQALRAVETGAAGGLDMNQLIARFFAGYQSLTNLIALLLQLFLVSRIFRWIGVGGALLVLPFLSLGGYAFISFGATLLLVRWVKSLENGTDYSLMNTTKAALFLVTPREEKYKAKAAIDTFFVRGGDALAALSVFLGTTFLGLAIEKFALLNVAGVVVWIVLCLLAIREYRKKRTQAAAADRVRSPA
jgi:AAA family ATP:ADP antiporter